MIEIIAILLSGLLGGLAPVGFILDQVIAGNVRSRLPGTEVLAVRIDNAPSYQLLGGKVQRLRLAGRGVQLTPAIRVAEIDIETDPISVDLEALRAGGENLRTAFREPLQAALRVKLSEADLNQALAAPQFAERLQSIVNQIVANFPGASSQSYELVDLSVNFQRGNRLGFNLQVQGRDAAGAVMDDLRLTLSTGLEVANGRTFELREPEIAINGEPLPPIFAGVATQFLGNQLDLRNLEGFGVVMRLLSLTIDDEGLEVAAFVRIAPEAVAAALE